MHEHDDERDLPEGVIDANPAGGWESAATADGETAEQNRDAAGSGALTDSGMPSTANVDGDIAEAPDVVETDAIGQVADPDLSSDEEN